MAWIISDESRGREGVDQDIAEIGKNLFNNNI